MNDVIIKELPYRLPQEVFETICSENYPFLLESSLVSSTGRYSFAGCNPYRIIDVKYGEENLCHQELRMLDNLPKIKLAKKPVPFLGGAVGFISYDFGRTIESLPESTQDDLKIPYFRFGLYAWIFAWDHKLQKFYIISTGFSTEHKENYCIEAKINFDKALALLTKNNCAGNKGDVSFSAKISYQFTKEEYKHILKKTIDYIKAGDIFQANISQRFEISPAPEPWSAYKKLTAINAAPFGCFLKYPDFCVACASPERFIQKKGTKIITYPIKGTRKRGATPKEDIILKKELWESKKDRAELAMIIDLERNDLNKICKSGTVCVPTLYMLQKLPSVWHLVSKITGRLRQNIKFSEIINAVFPGGSITGAPKIRAMEIIEELEKTRRGLYTGSIGYLGYDGDFDFNIVIRTAIFKNNKVYVQTGGGITALSDPEFEYEETFIKAKKFFAALGVKT